MLRTTREKILDTLFNFQLGAFCLSNMAFICPNMIYLMTVWERPGLGKYNWRLWKAAVLIIIGVFIFICGSFVNLKELLSVFTSNGKPLAGHVSHH